MGSFSVLRKVLILLACCPPFLPSTPAFAARPSARGHDESATKPLDAAFAYVEGLRASREGDRERAFELLGKAAQLKPTEPFIRLEYARVAASLGYSSRSFSDRKEKLDLALEQLRAARQLASGDFPVLKEVGALMLDLARDRAEVLPAAREALEAAREVNPRDLDVVFRLGQVYGAVGEPERAVEAFRVANQMAPGLPWLQSLLAQELMNVAKLRQREEKPAEEEALLREAMAVAPEKAAPRVRLFDLLRARNDHQAAVAVLDGLSPDQLDPSSRASLALELFVVGDLARGERLIKSFEEKQPGLKPYLALYQAALGRPAEAVHTLSELIEGDSSLAGLAGSVVSALIDAERGEAAAQLADLALVELAGSLSAEQIADLRLDRAQVALDQHDAEGARAVLAPLAANGGQGTQGEGWKLYYSEALFELGKTDEALAILPEKLEEGTPESQAPQVPLVAKRAELLLRGKRDAEAEALLVPLLASNNVHVIG
nr:hypothetical protein [Thermoanaerobaculia bacterium]